MIYWDVLGCTGLWAVLEYTGLDWAALGFDWLGWSLVRWFSWSSDLIQVVQVVQVVRMISIDDMHSENIYGFHGLNHQITKES